MYDSYIIKFIFISVLVLSNIFDNIYRIFEWMFLLWVLNIWEYDVFE